MSSNYFYFLSIFLFGLNFLFELKGVTAVGLILMKDSSVNFFRDSGEIFFTSTDLFFAERFELLYSSS